MAKIAGDLRLVTTNLDTVTSVSVRASKTRPQGDGLVLGYNAPVPVDNGRVEFDALPGPAVLALSHGGMATETVPLLVPDAGEVPLADAVRAASLADTATLSELEYLATQALADVNEVRRLRGEAEQLTRDAEVAAEKAEKAVDTPGRVGPPNVLKIGAVTSGAAAKAEVTGTAPEQTLNLTLPKGDTGAPAKITVGTVTTLAAGQQATASLSGTAPNFTLSLGLPQGAAGSTAWSAIQGKPTTFPPDTHGHTTSQVDGLDTALAGKLATTEAETTTAITGGKLARRTSGKQLQVDVDPSSGNDLTRKQYVDVTVNARTPQAVVVATVPATTVAGTIYYETG